MIAVYTKPFGQLRRYEADVETVGEALRAVHEQVFGSPFWRKNPCVMAVVPCEGDKS